MARVVRVFRIARLPRIAWMARIAWIARLPRIARFVGIGVLVAIGFGAWLALDDGVVEAWAPIAVSPSLEDRRPDGSPHTPSTQSFLRGEHCLDGVTAARIELLRNDRGRVRLVHPEVELELVDLPFDQLVPRLHYRPEGKPDAFDAFNLRLAEYSRNGLSVPAGKEGDSMARFETSLAEARPYHLEGDYRFVANPGFRPVRVAMINNCLAPGLWELSAKDRSGEIYHSWMTIPDGAYHRLVARTNGLPEAFVREALKWKTEDVEAGLSRLRDSRAPLGRVAARLVEATRSGYSSQDSRRKLAAGFALVERDGARVMPESLTDLTSHTVYLSSFIEPGKYSLTERREFDFTFLRAVRGAEVARTRAKTDYDWRNDDSAAESAAKSGAKSGAKRQPGCIELHLDLGGWVVVLGNLPIELLVPQEDFGMAGFGVGILPSSDFAERRQFRIEDGPPPSFAYLCRKTDGKLIAVNSHGYGIEQVFIRTHSNAAQPWWQITLTSYERIVDIVKYRVAIPPALVPELRAAAANYAAPLYRTYRDDNLR